MEEDNKGKKGPVGVFITFQRLLLRYRLTPTKFLFFLIVFGFFASLIIIGLGGNENSSPNINNAPRPENTIGTPLTDNQLNILASKERELSEREREIALKLTELEEKQLELNKQEQNIRVKEQEIDSRERTVQNKQQKLSELEKRFNDIESQLNQLDNPQSNNNDNNDNNNNYNNNNNNVDNIKREAVKGAFVYAWNGYKTKAWGQDELHPVDGSSSNWMGLGLTIIDSLDTLYIMGLKEEFNEAKEWIANNLRFDVAKSVSFFETTIRVIGGLLSAFELSKEQIFLNKADELGTRFLPAFNTPTGLPKTTINMLNGASSNPSWTGGAGVLSEMATVQLEFSYLSKYTNKPIYKEKAMKVYDHLNTIEKHNGLYSIYISTDSGRFTRNHITLGAMGDSFYEYLLKIYLLSGKTETKYLQMYDEAAQNIIDKLVKRSTPSNLVYIAELIDNRIVDKMDHLVCFAGAMFALGSLNFQGEKAKQHLQLGADITKTCYEFYHRTATGISGELVHFSQGNDFSFPGDARHYLLRPETVESLFVLWRITHDPIYREMGWEIFQAIDKHCKTTYGYSGIRDVTNPIPTYDNLQQSFFLAETLKYLYLLFSEDELIPLDKYVFNTEAHPLGIFQ